MFKKPKFGYFLMFVALLSVNGWHGVILQAIHVKELTSTYAQVYGWADAFSLVASGEEICGFSEDLNERSQSDDSSLLSWIQSITSTPLVTAFNTTDFEVAQSESYTPKWENTRSPCGPHRDLPEQPPRWV